MTVSSGFNGSCDYCSKPGYKQIQCFKFLRESDGDHYLRVAREEAVGSVCITPIFTTTLTAALSSNTVATATAAATTVATTTAATATDAIMTTALTWAEPTRQSQPTARLRLQSSPLPRLLRRLQVLHRLLRLLPMLILRRTSSSRLHRALAFRPSQAPLLRAR